MFFSIFCVWLSCFAVFLSSKQQAILALPLRKDVTWISFFLSLTFNIYIVAQHYSITVASLLTFANAMAMWIILVISHGHVKYSIIHYFIGCLLFALLIYWLGG